ncbi:sigma-70 family RNA polymerase sigma factor, partial [Bacteroides ovatus]
DQGLSDEIHHILKGLTGRQKEIIYLRFVHEMSFEEISEIMEINIQSARNLLTRSMEKLRKEVSSTTILFFIYMISI